MIDIIRKTRQGFFPGTVTTDQSKDTGMAMVLVCLLIGFLGEKAFFYKISIPILIITMIRPSLFRPLAKIWIGLSFLLGAVVSRIVLSIIFFFIVTPIGVLRRFAGIDTLQLKKWKKDSSSVFMIRNHIFTPKDIDKPY